MCNAISNSPRASTLRPGPVQNLLHRHLALALWSGDVADCPVHDERRDRVGGGRGIAQVTAQRGTTLNLHAPNERDGVDQPGVSSRNCRVTIDAITRHCRTDVQPVLRVEGEFVQLRDAFDVYNGADFAPPLAQLNEQISAAAQDACMLSFIIQNGDGFLDGGGWYIRERLHSLRLTGDQVMNQEDRDAP